MMVGQARVRVCRAIIFWLVGLLVVLVGATFEDQDTGHSLKTTTSTALSDATESQDKVKVELYYMPQCPGCRQLITTSFREAFSTPGFSDMADVTFVPYATHLNHDQQERVFDNILESCALNSIGRQHQELQFDYIDCIDHHDRTRNPDPSKVDRWCAVTIGLSAQQTRDIETCAVSLEGRILAERNVWQAKAMGATYYPWIVVDREHTAAVEDAVWESLFDYVCQLYSGPRKSPECPFPEEDYDDDLLDRDDDDDEVYNDYNDDSIAQQL